MAKINELQETNRAGVIHRPTRTPPRWRCVSECTYGSKMCLGDVSKQFTLVECRRCGWTSGKIWSLSPFGQGLVGRKRSRRRRREVMCQAGRCKVQNPKISFRLLSSSEIIPNKTISTDMEMANSEHNGKKIAAK